MASVYLWRAREIQDWVTVNRVPGWEGVWGHPCPPRDCLSGIYPWYAAPWCNTVCKKSCTQCTLHPCYAVECACTQCTLHPCYAVECGVLQSGVVCGIYPWYAAYGAIQCVCSVLWYNFCSTLGYPRKSLYPWCTAIVHYIMATRHGRVDMVGWNWYASHSMTTYPRCVTTR